MSGEERTVLFQLPTMMSGQLICTQGTLAGRSWNLSAGTFVIGRAPGSDLALGTEPGVSKLHAKIVAEGDHYALVDNESRNGTIVNGRPIQKVRLNSGDQIRICNCVLRFTQTGGGFPISMEGPAASSDDEPDFDAAGGTSPEVADMTAADGPPPSMEPPSARPSLAEPRLAAPGQPTAMLPSPRPPATGPAAPTNEYVASGVDVPRPPPEVRVQSAAPWFAIGLVVMVMLGTGAWASVRFLGDALLGPMPTALAKGEADAPNDPIAQERAAEARKAAEGQAAGGQTDDGAAPASDGDDVAEGSGDPRAPLEGSGDDAAADGRVAERAAAGDASADDIAASEDAAAAKEKNAVEAKRPLVAARKPAKANTTQPQDTADDDDDSAAAAAAAAGSSWYAVVVERDGPVSVKTRAGGTVAVVAANDGQTVKKGELLFSFEDAGSDEISNLRANIEALEAVAESQPSAQEMLDREKEKLKRLLAKSSDVNVTAPAAGTLTGFAVKVGDKLKGGDAIGTVERGGATLVVNVSAADGRRLKKGGGVELKTKAGTANGRIASVKKRGGGYRVAFESDASPDDINEARFP